jgi:hypothetical protein
MYFTDFAQVKDKRLNKELKEDVHVSPEDILEKSNTPLDVPQGYGALGLRVNAASTAGGFVWPGDKVDVILTQRGTKVTVQTILRDVLVLAVGDKQGRPDGDAGALQANTVAVALKPEEAQLVRLAESLGELSLLLRKEGDTPVQTTKVTTEDDLLRTARGIGPQPPTAAAPAEDPNKLPLIGLTLPELEKLGKKDPPKAGEEPEKEKLGKKDPPKAEEEPEKEPVRKPTWTLTIYPGYDPPIQQHYFDNPQGGVTRDDGDPAVDPKTREKKEPTADPKARDKKEPRKAEK